MMSVILYFEHCFKTSAVQKIAKIKTEKMLSLTLGLEIYFIFCLQSSLSVKVTA